MSHPKADRQNSIFRSGLPEVKKRMSATRIDGLRILRSCLRATDRVCVATHGGIRVAVVEHVAVSIVQRMRFRAERFVELNDPGMPALHAQVEHFDEDAEAHCEVDVAFGNVLAEAFRHQGHADQ